MTQELILGSSSESRRMALSQIGLKLKQISPDIDETARQGEQAKDLVTRLGKEKSIAVAKIAPKESLLITGDQVLECEGKIFGKPLTAENAIAQLNFFSGKKATFFTNICLMNNATDHLQSVTIATEMKFKDLSEDKITRYVEIEKPLKCAGSIKIEGLGVTLIEKVSCNDLHAILGMPLMHLCSMLEKESFKIF